MQFSQFFSYCMNLDELNFFFFSILYAEKNVGSHFYHLYEKTGSSKIYSRNNHKNSKIYYIHKMVKSTKNTKKYLYNKS